MLKKNYLLKTQFKALFIAQLLFQFSYSQNFTTVDTWLDNNIKDLGGRAVILIYKDRKIIYTKEKNEVNRKQKMGAKWLKRKTGKEINLDDFTVDTKQPIASCSKWLTAALVMTFVDEKKLSLEDTIGKYLPIMTAHHKGSIKIWQCLSHLTGIKQTGVMDNIVDGEDGENSKGKVNWRDKLKDRSNNQSTNKVNSWTSMDAAMDCIANDTIEGVAGKIFHYGNTGLQIAAAIIEKIGHKDFETLFQERIVQQLEMKSTDFGKTKMPLAAGGGWSTPNDYIKFLQMILNEGMFNGKQVISKNSIIEMQQNRVAKDATIVYSPAEAGDWSYGFGEWVMDKATPNNRSDIVTSPGLFGTFPWVDNNQKYAAILFTVNIKSKGRHERYNTLKKLVDDAIRIKN